MSAPESRSAAAGARNAAAALRAQSRSMALRVVQEFYLAITGVPATPVQTKHPCMVRQGSVAFSQLDGHGHAADLT